MEQRLLILFACLSYASISHVTASLFNRCSNTNAMSNFTAIDLDNMDWYEVARSPSSSNNCTRFFILVEELDLTMQQSLINSNGEVVNSDISYTVDPNGNGAIVAEVPEPNWFWRLLGYSTKKVTLKMVATDYDYYMVTFRCNDDSFWRSYDEIVISVSGIIQAADNITYVLDQVYESGKESGLLSAKQISNLKRVEQSDALCVALDENGKH